MLQLINSKFCSPNFSHRAKKIKYIILHYTEMTFKGAIERLCNPKTKVSAHYLIKKDGEIFQLVKDENIAFHAGVSSWHGVNALNENSLGIEIDNSGACEFRPEQIKSCIGLCNKLIYQYNLSRINILGHSDIAPNRKIDPGIFFPWHELASNQIGIWSQSCHNNFHSEVMFNYGESDKQIFNLQSNLKKLGYKINLTGNFDTQTNYVVRAFQSHFYPKIITKKGIDFYRNLDAKYYWDITSNNILLDLIKTF